MNRKLFAATALAVCLALAFAIISAGDRLNRRTSDDASRGAEIRTPDSQALPSTFDPAYARYFDGDVVELMQANATASTNMVGETSAEAKAQAYLNRASKQEPAEAYVTLNLALGLLEGRTTAKSKRLLGVTYENLANLYDDSRRQLAHLEMAAANTASPGLRQELTTRIAALGGGGSSQTFVGIARRDDRRAGTTPQDFGPDDICSGGPQVGAPSVTRMSIADPFMGFQDQNWLQIVIAGPDGEALDIETTSPYCNDAASCSAEEFDTDMTLWKSCDSGGNPDTVIERDLDRGDGGLGWLSRINTDCLLPGTYYLQVWGQIGSAPKDFDVEVRVTATCESPVPDHYEPDNTVPDANRIGHPDESFPFAHAWAGWDWATQNHSIFPTNDDDHVKVKLGETNYLRIGTAEEFGFKNTNTCKVTGDECHPGFGEEFPWNNWFLNECDSLCSTTKAVCAEDADCQSMCGATGTFCTDDTECELLCGGTGEVCADDSECSLTCSRDGEACLDNSECASLCRYGGNACADVSDCPGNCINSIFGTLTSRSCDVDEDCPSRCSYAGNTCSSDADCQGVCSLDGSSCPVGTTTFCDKFCDVDGTTCSRDSDCTAFCNITGSACDDETDCQITCSDTGESCFTAADCSGLCSDTGDACFSAGDCSGVCSATGATCGGDGDCYGTCSIDGPYTGNICITSAHCFGQCSDTGESCEDATTCGEGATCDPQTCEGYQGTCDGYQTCDPYQACDTLQTCDTIQSCSVRQDCLDIQTCLPPGPWGSDSGSSCDLPNFGFQFVEACDSQSCDTCQALQSCDASQTCDDASTINPCVDSYRALGTSEDTQIIMYIDDDPNDGGVCNKTPLSTTNFCRSNADCDAQDPPATGAYPPGACIPLTAVTFPGEARPRFQEFNPIAFNDDKNAAKGDFGSELTMCLPKTKWWYWQHHDDDDDPNAENQTHNPTGNFNPTLSLQNNSFVVRARGWRPPFPGATSDLAFDYQIRATELGPCAYEDEPNNQLEDARPIGPNETISGMSEGMTTAPMVDDDWYGPWDVIGGGINDPEDTGKSEVSIQVFAGPVALPGDSEAEVWAGPTDAGDFVFVGSENTCSNTGDPCSSNADCPGGTCIDLSGNRPNTILNLTLPPANRLLRNTMAQGAYYLRVYNKVLVPNFYYTVTIVTPRVDYTEVEPNDTEKTANVVDFRGNTVIMAEIAAACDIDRFRLTLNESRFISTFTKHPSTDTVLQVQQVNDVGGEEVFDFIACADDNEEFAGNPYLSRLEGCLPAGEYVVSVRGWNQTTGPYELFFSGPPGCSPSSPPDMEGDGSGSSFCPENGWPFERLCN